MSRNNNVRGPTSALTEFLKESGITPTTIARRRETQQPVAGPSNLGQNDSEHRHDGGENEEQEQESQPRRPSRASRKSGYGSDNLDESEEEPPTTKKRKLSKKAKAKENAKKNAKKDKDEDDDDDENAYTALSQSMWTNRPSTSARPPVGSFKNCARCEKQFTVTKYTMAANSTPGFLCHQCAKASGSDPFKKPALSRKRKIPSDKRSVTNIEERRIPTLASLCIRIISHHIDDVEALGDIGSVNLTEISKAISKNRSLTPENVHLFYDIQNTNLTLYDATKLTPSAFTTLAYLNPKLTSLRLDLCGRIDDSVMNAWCTSLPSLTHLELLGPFLVRVESWKAFFQAHPQLEGFLITQSPRFDLECLESLVSNCMNLKNVRLREIGKIDDTFLGPLKQLKGTLRVLDLAEPAESLSEEGLIDLMSAIGSALTHLDLSKHHLITDAFLDEGIKPHAQGLTTLSLSDVPQLTDEGVAKFFNTWAEVTGDNNPNPPLTFLDLSRNQGLSSDALSAILMHSGSGLQHLNINGWNTISGEALEEIGKRAKDLRSLDAGWCRELDDFVVKGLLEACERLKKVKCWGCNRVSENCPRKVCQHLGNLKGYVLMKHCNAQRNVNIFGVESHTVL